MYTNNEAIDLVANRQEPDYSKLYGSPFPEIDECIIDHIKSGWLGANIRHLLNNPIQTAKVKTYLNNLGYTMDKDGIVYWCFRK